MTELQDDRMTDRTKTKLPYSFGKWNKKCGLYDIIFLILQKCIECKLKSELFFPKHWSQQISHTCQNMAKEFGFNINHLTEQIAFYAACME